MILVLSTSVACPVATGLVCGGIGGCCVPHPTQAIIAAHKPAWRNEARMHSPRLRLGLSVALRIGILHPESQNCPGTLAIENSLLSYRLGLSMSSACGRMHLFTRQVGETLKRA